MSDKTYAGCAVLLGLTLLLASASMLVGHTFGTVWGWSMLMASMGAYFIACAIVAGRRGGDDE